MHLPLRIKVTTCHTTTLSNLPSEHRADSRHPSAPHGSSKMLCQMVTIKAPLHISPWPPWTLQTQYQVQSSFIIRATQTSRHEPLLHGVLFLIREALPAVAPERPSPQFPYQAKPSPPPPTHISTQSQSHAHTATVNDSKMCTVPDLITCTAGPENKACTTGGGCKGPQQSNTA